MLDTSELLGAIGGHDVDPDQDIINRFRDEEALDIPIELTDLDLWSNYVNNDLYTMDVKIREFFRKTRYAREKKGGFKTTVPVIFSWIYGRQPEPKDSSTCRTLHELLKYYCTAYRDNTTYKGKKVTRVYEFSRYSVTNKRPYSLRLRLETHEKETNPFRASGYGDHDKRRVGRRVHSEDGKTKD